MFFCFDKTESVSNGKRIGIIFIHTHTNFLTQTFSHKVLYTKVFYTYSKRNPFADFRFLFNTADISEGLTFILNSFFIYSIASN